MDELLPNRYALLNSIDFTGDTRGKVDYEKWTSMFQRLVEYKKEHKNTKVPQQYDEDPKLGMWVHTQRSNYQKDKLLPKRLVLLNSIDFT